MGNTLFINENNVAYPDQWAYLSTISRMNRKEIDGIVDKASREGKIIGVRIPVIEEKDEEPWKLLLSRKEKEHPIPGPLPKKINLILSNLVYIKKEVRIYDYTDLNVSILEKMHKRRLRGYRAIGYDIS